MSYKIVFAPQSQRDIQDSYEWGCKAWGPAQARRWVRELRAAISKQLSVFPLANSLAPDQAEYEIEVRQFLFLRYRVLYTVDKKTVYILAVRGAYTEPDSITLDE